MPVLLRAATAGIAAVLCTIMLAGRSPAQVPLSPSHATNWLNPQTLSAVDSLFTQPAGAPGYAVGIIKDGEFVYRKGFGLANLDDDVPITPDTSFHLASVSKQFTAAAIALLVLDHKVSLTDPVSKYIPEMAKFGPNLRIEHLVYMTSGLPEYTDLPRYGGQPWMTFYYFTRDDAITALLKTEKLQFEPGTEWAYRNINYMLLTKIVEVVSHQPFADFMQGTRLPSLGNDAYRDQ